MALSKYEQDMYEERSNRREVLAEALEKHPVEPYVTKHYTFSPPLLARSTRDGLVAITSIVVDGESEWVTVLGKKVKVVRDEIVEVSRSISINGKITLMDGDERQDKFREEDSEEDGEEDSEEDSEEDGA